MLGAITFLNILLTVIILTGIAGTVCVVMFWFAVLDDKISLGSTRAEKKAKQRAIIAQNELLTAKAVADRMLIETKRDRLLDDYINGRSIEAPKEKEEKMRFPPSSGPSIIDVKFFDHDN